MSKKTAKAELRSSLAAHVVLAPGSPNIWPPTEHPIEVIARQTGFVDRDRMRRAFLRAFKQPPQVIRRNARAEVTI
jgi:AraC-like DNA-binding protein